MLWIEEKMMSKTLIRTTALIATFTLAACATPAPTYKPTHIRNAVQVAESVERLELYTRPNGLELSARDTLAVSQFLDGYARSGDGPLFINRPANALSGLGTQQAEAKVRQLMAQGGMNPGALKTGQYASAPGAPAPVIVSYRTLKAIPQDCRQMGNMASTYANQPHSSFGCFQSANLAAMVSDPRQLLEPYAVGTPNSQRRQVVYDKYIQGEATSAQVNPRQEVGAGDGGGGGN